MARTTVPNTRSFIISGAASGIGRHMALSLARRGQGLMLLDRDAEGLERTRLECAGSDTGRVIARVHDVRDARGWEHVVEEAAAHFGTLDVMLNIAGTLKPGYLSELSESDVDLHFDVNTKGIVHATRAGARQMLRQGHGHIVNIASIAAISHVPGLSLYCASKHAVRGFSLAVAHELRPAGIHVSVVCPDAVETPMLELQTAHEAAAMTFGGGRGLRLPEVEEALLEVLEQRPLERVLPIPGSGRAALAQLANVFPALATLGIERVRRAGLRTQRMRQKVRPGTP